MKFSPPWLRGLFPVVPTPFGVKEILDLQSLAGLVECLADEPLNGLTLLGSGGENVYLGAEEKIAVVRSASRALRGRRRLIAGVLEHSTRSAERAARVSADAGADALLVGMLPYYSPSFETVVRHFEAVCRAVDVPVLYYHYPAALRFRLSAIELRELFARVPLAGVKSSALSTPELRQQVRALPSGAAIFTGFSVNLFETLRSGGAGAICPLVLLMPRTASRLLRAAERGAWEEAKREQLQLCSALGLCVPGLSRAPELLTRVFRGLVNWGVPLPQKDALPHASVKVALAARGLSSHAEVRGPQRPLTRSQTLRVIQSAARFCELGPGQPRTSTRDTAVSSGVLRVSDRAQ